MSEVNEVPQQFPEEVIQGTAGEFSYMLSEYIEAPPQFPFMAFLTCLGNLCTGRLKIASAIQPDPRLYCLLLGPSNSSRKSTTIKITLKLFERIQGFNVCHGVGSDIGLLGRLEKKKNLLLIQDEFKALASKSGISGSALLPCIASLFDSTKYENQTKTKNLIIKNGHLSILAASTPETYEDTWKPEFTSIGLNNRLWIVPGNGTRGKAFPPEIPDKEMGPILRYLQKINDIIGDGLKIQITPEARTIYQEWNETREASVYSDRLESYALRLMPLMSLNQHESQILPKVVKWVIMLLDWQLKVRKLHSPVDGDTQVAKMEEKIRRQLEIKGPMKNRDLRNFTNAKRPGLWVFGAALDNLIKAEEIKLIGKKEYELLP